MENVFVFISSTDAKCRCVYIYLGAIGKLKENTEKPSLLRTWYIHPKIPAQPPHSTQPLSECVKNQAYLLFLYTPSTPWKQQQLFVPEGMAHFEENLPVLFKESLANSMLSAPSFFSKHPWMQLTSGSLPSHWTSPDKEHQKSQGEINTSFNLQHKMITF